MTTCFGPFLFKLGHHQVTTFDLMMA